MRKIVCFLSAMMLLLSLCSVALAQSFAPGSLAIDTTEIDGKERFTLESYPEIWMSAFTAKDILEGKKKNPPRFLHVSPPQNTLPTVIGLDRVAFVSDEEGLTYYYYLFKVRSFRVFLQNVPEERVIADAKDQQLAIYVGEENHRIYALLTLPESEFGEKGKLEINITDHTGTRSQAELERLMQEELGRVQRQMSFEVLDQFWCQGVYTTANLSYYNGSLRALVDLSDLIVERMDGASNLKCKFLTEEGKAKDLFLRLDTYSYAHHHHQSEEKTEEVTLADGTVWRVFPTKTRCYAGREIADASLGGVPVYLTVEAEASPDAFAELLEAWSGSIQVTAP